MKDGTLKRAVGALLLIFSLPAVAAIEPNPLSRFEGVGLLADFDSQRISVDANALVGGAPRCITIPGMTGGSSIGKACIRTALQPLRFSSDGATSPPDLIDMHMSGWAGESQLPINGAAAKLPCGGPTQGNGGTIGRWCPKKAALDSYEPTPPIDVATKCLVYIPERTVNGGYYPEVCITKLPSRRALFEGLPQEQLPAPLMAVAAICLLWSDGTSDLKPGAKPRGGSSSGGGASIGRYCVIRQR